MSSWLFICFWRILNLFPCEHCGQSFIARKSLLAHAAYNHEVFECLFFLDLSAQTCFKLAIDTLYNSSSSTFDFSFVALSCLFTPIGTNIFWSKPYRTLNVIIIRVFIFLTLFTGSLVYCQPNTGIWKIPSSDIRVTSSGMLLVYIKIKAMHKYMWMVAQLTWNWNWQTWAID